MSIKLRHYQEKAVDNLRKSFRKFRSTLLVLPTGSGKTVVFTYMSQQASLKNKRVLILVHRVELLRQTSEALTKFDVDHGMISPAYTPKFNSLIQVASVQTLIRRLTYLKAMNWTPDLIVIDESHRVLGKTYRTIIQDFTDCKILGVTATPIRGDGQGLGIASGGLFEDMVEGSTVQQLIDEGYLVRPRVFGAIEDVDLSDVSTSMGDYQKDQLALAMDKPKITGDAVEHFKELCPDSPTVVFCVTVAHAEHVALQFREAGYRFYAVDGTMDDEKRKSILGGLANGSVQGVCSCDLISEGTDIPAIGCAILLRPTKSKGLYLQQVGRALRPCEGKEYAFILDHVGNTQRHGLPYQQQNWSLEGETKKRKKKANDEAPVRVVMCDNCYMHQEPAVVCAGCGQIMKAPKDNTPKQVEGKLQEITSSDLKRTAKSEQGQAQTLEALLKVAALRGHKPEWATHVYLSKQKKLEKLKGLIAPVPVPPAPVELNMFNDNLEF